jgi:hypothetical protein
MSDRGGCEHGSTVAEGSTPARLAEKALRRAAAHAIPKWGYDTSADRDCEFFANRCMTLDTGAREAQDDVAPHVTHKGDER